MRQLRCGGARENGFIQKEGGRGCHPKLVVERLRWDLEEVGSVGWDFLSKNFLPFSPKYSRDVSYKMLGVPACLTETREAAELKIGVGARVRGQTVLMQHHCKLGPT